MTRRARAGLVAALAVVLAVTSFGPARASAQKRQVVLIVLPPSSFEELLSGGRLRGLAELGGAGLMTTRVGSGDRLAAAQRTIGSGALASSHVAGPSPLQLALAAAGVASCEVGPGGEALPVGAKLVLWAGASNACPTDSGLQVVHLDRSEGLATGTPVRGFGPSPRPDRVLVIVLAPAPSSGMDRSGDEVTPIVIADGPPGRVFRPSVPTAQPWHGLTSDTTRQEGLISNVDVAPTILQYLGIPISSEMDGEPIRVTNGPAPFDLHRLHLEHRRSRIPVQLAELAFIVVTGLLAIGATAVASKRKALDPRLARWLRFAFLTASALLLVLLAGGRLPHLTYGSVFPFVAVAMVGIAAASLVFSRRDPFGPFTFIGALGLAFLLFDAATGDRAMRMPLYGGTMFDGARFYGLPNAFLPLLLASALFVARPLTPLQGFLVLVGAGLFAGFPSMGADVGGAITLFAAAGLWWVLRTRPRIRVKEVALVAGVALIGLGVVLLANRYLPGAHTHATRFVERSGSAFDTIRHRLGTGVHQIASQPATLIPLIGMLAVFVLVIRGRGVIGEAMALDRRWRDLVLTLVIASGVALVVNDTGASAAGPAFIYAMAGIAYPTMLVVERRAAEPKPAMRPVEAST